jgi:hypothetical protein
MSAIPSARAVSISCSTSGSASGRRNLGIAETGTTSGAASISGFRAISSPRDFRPCHIARMLRIVPRSRREVCGHRNGPPPTTSSRIESLDRQNARWRPLYFGTGRKSRVSSVADGGAMRRSGGSLLRRRPTCGQRAARYPAATRRGSKAWQVQACGKSARLLSATTLVAAPAVAGEAAPMVGIAAAVEVLKGSSEGPRGRMGGGPPLPDRWRIGACTRSARLAVSDVGQKIKRPKHSDRQCRQQ